MGKGVAVGFLPPLEYLTERTFEIDVFEGVLAAGAMQAVVGALWLFGQCSIFVRNADQLANPPLRLKIDERFVDGLADTIATWAAEGLGRLVAQLHALRRMSVSVAGMLHAGKEPVIEAAIVKDVGTIWEQRLPHKARDLAAFITEATGNRASFEEQLRSATMIAPKLTIQGGTTEILRGIIARGLGLR